MTQVAEFRAYLNQTKRKSDWPDAVLVSVLNHAKISPLSMLSTAPPVAVPERAESARDEQEPSGASHDNAAMLIAYLDALIDADGGDKVSEAAARKLREMLIGNRQSRELQTQMATQNAQGVGAFDESKHPRDDIGRFVNVRDMAEAATDPLKAKTLRERVTKPEEREKLDAVLGREGEHELIHHPAAQAAHAKHGIDIAEFHKLAAKQHGNAILGGFIDKEGLAGAHRMTTEILRSQKERRDFEKDRPNRIAARDGAPPKNYQERLDDRDQKAWEVDEAERMHTKQVREAIDVDQLESLASDVVDGTDEDGRFDQGLADSLEGLKAHCRDMVDDLTIIGADPDELKDLKRLCNDLFKASKEQLETLKDCVGKVAEATKALESIPEDAESPEEPKPLEWEGKITRNDDLSHIVELGERLKAAGVKVPPYPKEPEPEAGDEPEEPVEQDDPGDRPEVGVDGADEDDVEAWKDDRAARDEWVKEHAAWQKEYAAWEEANAKDEEAAKAFEADEEKWSDDVDAIIDEANEKRQAEWQEKVDAIEEANTELAEKREEAQERLNEAHSAYQEAIDDLNNASPYDDIDDKVSEISEAIRQQISDEEEADEGDEEEEDKDKPDDKPLQQRTLFSTEGPPVDPQTVSTLSTLPSSVEWVTLFSTSYGDKATERMRKHLGVPNFDPHNQSHEGAVANLGNAIADLKLAKGVDQKKQAQQKVEHHAGRFRRALGLEHDHPIDARKVSRVHKMMTERQHLGKPGTKENPHELWTAPTPEQLQWRKENPGGKYTPLTRSQPSAPSKPAQPIPPAQETVTQPSQTQGNAGGAQAQPIDRPSQQGTSSKGSVAQAAPSVAQSGGSPVARGTQSTWQRLPVGSKSPISGRVIRSEHAWYDQKSGRLVYGEQQPGQHQKQSDAAQSVPPKEPPQQAATSEPQPSPKAGRAHALADKIAAHASGTSKEEPTQDDYHELVNEVGKLPTADRVAIRNKVLGSFGEHAAKKEMLANALREHIKRRIVESGADKNTVDKITHVTGSVFGKDDVTLHRKSGATEKLRNTLVSQAAEHVLKAPDGPEKEAAIDHLHKTLAERHAAKAAAPVEPSEVIPQSAPPEVKSQPVEQSKQPEVKVQPKKSDLSEVTPEVQAVIDRLLPSFDSYVGRGKTLKDKVETAQNMISTRGDRVQAAMLKRLREKHPEVFHDLTAIASTNRDSGISMDAVRHAAASGLPNSEQEKRAESARQEPEARPPAAEPTVASPLLLDQPVAEGERASLPGEGDELLPQVKAAAEAKRQAQEASKKEKSYDQLIHSLAQEHRKQHNEPIHEHNRAIKYAEELIDGKNRGGFSDEFGGLSPRNLKKMIDSGKIDESMIPAFDQIAQQVASQHRDLFPRGSDNEVDYAGRLFEMLQEGKKKPMTMDEARKHIQDLAAENDYNRRKAGGGEDENGVVTQAKANLDHHKHAVAEEDKKWKDEIEDAKTHSNDAEIGEAVRANVQAANRDEPDEPIEEDADFDGDRSGDGEESGDFDPADLDFNPAEFENEPVKEVKRQEHASVHAMRATDERIREFLKGKGITVGEGETPSEVLEKFVRRGGRPGKQQMGPEGRRLMDQYDLYKTEGQIAELLHNLGRHVPPGVSVGDVLRDVPTHERGPHGTQMYLKYKMLKDTLEPDEEEPLAAERPQPSPAPAAGPPSEPAQVENSNGEPASEESPKSHGDGLISPEREGHLKDQFTLEHGHDPKNRTWDQAKSDAIAAGSTEQEFLKTMNDLYGGLVDFRDHLRQPSKPSPVKPTMSAHNHAKQAIEEASKITKNKIWPSMTGTLRDSLNTLGGEETSMLDPEVRAGNLRHNEALRTLDRNWNTVNNMLNEVGARPPSDKKINEFMDHAVDDIRYTISGLRAKGRYQLADFYEQQALPLAESARYDLIERATAKRGEKK